MADMENVYEDLIIINLYHIVAAHQQNKPFVHDNLSVPIASMYKAKSQLMITMQVQRLHKKEEDKRAIFVEKFFEKWNLLDHIVNAHQKKKNLYL